MEQARVTSSIMSLERKVFAAVSQTIAEYAVRKALKKFEVAR